MKLVQILARELVEWPEDAYAAVQDNDPDHTIWFLQDGHEPLEFQAGEWLCDSAFDILISQPSELADDHASSIVYRSDWESFPIARHASAPEIEVGIAAADEGKMTPIEEVKDRYDGPIKWRDRITEIDTTTSALATERAELVQKLASEGFALIGRVVEPVEDMSDWRNWKVGDFVERIGGDSKYYSFGARYTVERTSDSAIWLQDDTDEGGHMWFGAGIITENFKWHSRPSA